MKGESNIDQSAARPRKRQTDRHAVGAPQPPQGFASPSSAPTPPCPYFRTIIIVHRTSYKNKHRDIRRRKVPQDKENFEENGTNAGRYHINRVEKEGSKQHEEKK
jgi:hypothetical protein